MNSQNRETPRQHRQLLNLPDKIILKRSNKYVDL